jgi:hypothetical protein
LPDASVWGYTDTALIHDIFRWIHKPDKEVGSEFVEVHLNNEKGCE